MGWCLPRAARRLKKPGRQPTSLLPTETQQRLQDIRRLLASRARLGVPAPHDRHHQSSDTFCGPFTTRRTIIMTSTASDTPKVSTGFDINAEFRSMMHELGLSPEDTGG